MKDNLISVIIPVFQGESCIESCLKSVLNQSYQNLEIIVINDGSTDLTQKIVEKMKMDDERIKLINQTNQGVSKARNEGIRLASGEYTMFLDADDKLQQDLCEKLLDTMKDRDVDVVISGITFVENGVCRVVLSEKLELLTKEFFEDCFETHNGTYVYQNVLGKLYKTEVIKRFSFDPNIRLGEDLMFNYNIYSLISKMCIVPYSGYIYISNDKSATKSFHESDFAKQKIVWEHAMEYYRETLGKEGISRSIDKTYVANVINIIISLVSTKNYNESLVCLKEYLNDIFFQEKLARYHDDDIRMRIKAYICRYKMYIVIYLYGKLRIMRNTIINVKINNIEKK